MRKEGAGEAMTKRTEGGKLRIVNLVEDTPGSRQCGSEHGLSFYVETGKHRLLVDCGATDLFLKNAALLGTELSGVDTVIISHGHYDHAGGVPAFARLNPGAKIYVKASAREAYYHLMEKGEKYIGMPAEIGALSQCVWVEGDLQIDEELFLFTDIGGTKYPASGNQRLKRKQGDRFVQDTFDHEQCLVIAQGERQILMSGCAHTGIANILDRYNEIFGKDPDVVISGFHLAQKAAYSAEELENIRRLSRELAEKNTLFFTGHCTGQAAFAIMKEIMGEKLAALHSGDEIVL